MPRDPKNILKMEFSSRSENIAFARTAAAVFASQLDFTIDQIDDIKVAVSEAVTNAIVHGYRDAPGMVRVELRLYADALEVVVGDSGVGIPDVDWAMQPGNTTDESSVGLGLVFMKEYMDDMELRSAPGTGTQAIMRKRVGQQLRH